MYKAVIFDLDGTLVDSLTDIAACMNHTFEAFGYPTYSVDEYRFLVGSGIRTIAEKKLPDLPEADICTLVEAYEPYYIEHNSDTTKVFDGIHEMIDALKKNGVKMAVLSNKPHNQAVSVVNKYFKEGTFDVIWGRMEKFPLKPDPTSVLAMLEEMGASPEDSVYVGDMEGDMLVARNAHMAEIGVSWGIRGEKSFIDIIPAALANTPKELCELILKNA